MRVVVFGAKETTKIYRLSLCGINLFVEYFGSGHNARVARNIHITKGNIWTVDVIKEVAGGFGVLCILWDHPTIEPHIAPLFRYHVIKR